MEIDATTSDGNGGAIMGIVCTMLKQSGRRDEVKDVRRRMMSGDYDNLCDVAEEVSDGSIKVINRHGDDDEDEDVG